MAGFKLNEIKSLSYEHPVIKNGYTDKSLHVNVLSSDISIKDIDKKVKEKFIGGKGYDLWFLWHAV